MKRRTSTLWVLMAIVTSLFFTTNGLAQNISGPTEGILPFETAAGGTYDSINLANLSINIHAPIRSKAGLMPFSYTFSANEPTVALTGSPGSQYSGPTGLLGMRVGSTMHVNGGCHIWARFNITDSMGNKSTFPNNPTVTDCPGGQTDSDVTTDGTNIGISIDASSGNPVVTLTDNRSGYHTTTSGVSDANGNMITAAGNPYNGGYTVAYTDTLNQPVLTATIPYPVTGTYWTWNDSLGVQQKASQTVTQNLYWGTNFCGTSYTLNLPTTIVSGLTFADRSTLSIGFETASGMTNPQGGPYYTGRFTSLTVPAGATIQYQYSGGGAGGINCTDYTPNTMKRITPDGTWTYVHTPPPGGGSIVSTTVVTDPLLNETDYTFQGQYETLRKIYFGSGTTKTLIKTVQTCYNGSCTNNILLPITEVDSYTTLAGQTVATRVQALFNALDLPTQVNYYSNSTTLVKSVIIAYGSWSNSSGSCATVASVGGRVCYSQVWDETGTPTMVSNTRNTYDTSGNLTSVAVWTGTQYLTTSVVNNTNGTPNTITSPLGLVSTFGYSCNNGLQSSISYNVAVGGSNLSTGAVQDCNGAAPTGTSDMNGQGQTIGYGDDPFYRPVSVTDALGNQTITQYGAAATVVTTTYPTSNSATNVSTSYADTLGRPFNSQTKDGTTYDTQTLYRNWTGAYFNTQSTMPCSEPSQTPCPSTSSVTTNFDVLGRTVSSVDANGKTMSYSYYPATVAGNNVVDMLVSMSGKNMQYEYDALGRLLSVCEVSTQAGSGACGQANSKSGFVTSYKNNVLGKILQVTQGAQTRASVYDAMGRLTSETNPESGTTTYQWDVASSCTNSTTFLGRLVRTADANGNSTCFTYDLFGRIASKSVTGPNAGATPYTFFVYDAATYSGTAMAYAKGHIAEAYTTTCSTCSPTTDEFFSYNKRSDLTDVWEKTPHSPTAYYHTTTAPYPNGVIASLTVPGGTTNLSWALDGKAQQRNRK
jgi:YD repeat-containing protein